jgi:hypothetical protein
MKYKNIIKLTLPEIQLLAVVPTQLKFGIVKDHDEPTVLLFETLFCMWEGFNMGTELPAKVMLGQTLVVMQMPFLNNVRKVGRLVLFRTSCLMHMLCSHKYSQLFLFNSLCFKISMCNSHQERLEMNTEILYLLLYKPHFFDKNLPSKIGVRLIHGIKKRP